MNDTSSTPLDRDLPPWWRTGSLVARLFFKTTLGKRRRLWIGLVISIPVLLAVWWRLFEQGQAVDWFQKVALSLFLQFFALGLPLYFGVSAVWDEIEDKTITYLFSRPIHRAVILGSKWLAVVAVLTLLMLIDVLLVYLIAVSRDGLMALSQGAPKLLLVSGVLSLAILVYTCLFAFIGVLLRRPMVVALVIGFGWEVVLSNLPGSLPRVTLMYYLKSLLGVQPGADQFLALFIPPGSLVQGPAALMVLLASAVVFLFSALIIGGRKEFRI